MWDKIKYVYFLLVHSCKYFSTNNDKTDVALDAAKV